jgi:outer membrane protein OmpU
MDNFKKVGLTALGTALVASTSYAGEVGVSGTMKMVLSNEEKADKGNGWTMNQSLIFSGSSDLDNGWTVSYMQNVVAGVTGNATLGIDMGDMGTLSFWCSWC